MSGPRDDAPGHGDPGQGGPGQSEVAQAGPCVYLVRHGRTAGNGRAYVGWMDLSLDPTGQAQAVQAGRLLARQRIDRVHASDLHRAVLTARALGLAAPLHTHAALREIDYGAHTGRSKQGLRLRLRRDHATQALPDGESLADVDRRVRTYLSQHLNPALHAGAALVVVAHYWSLRLLLAALRGQTFGEAVASSEYKPANGSVLVWRKPAAAPVSAPVSAPAAAAASASFEAQTRWLWRGDGEGDTETEDPHGAERR